MIKLKRLILLTLAVLVIYVSSWKSSEVNHNTKYSIEGCMHLGKKKNIIIGDFNIDYVENSISIKSSHLQCKKILDRLGLWKKLD